MKRPAKRRARGSSPLQPAIIRPPWARRDGESWSDYLGRVGVRSASCSVMAGTPCTRFSKPVVSRTVRGLYTRGVPSCDPIPEGACSTPHVWEVCS